MNRLALLIAGAFILVLGAALYLARERITQQPTALKAVSQVATDKAREAPSKPPASQSATTQGKMAAVRKPEPAAVERAPEAAKGPEKAPEERRAVTASEKAATPPTFDVVRVEPSGAVVMAGRAAPGATVEILLDGRAVAAVQADAAGEWTFVPDAPLFTGSHQLALRMKADGREVVSIQTLAVSMEPVSRGAAPLVVLSAPDAPSRVLQQPKPAPAVEEKRVAAAEEKRVAEAQPAAEATAPEVEKRERPAAATSAGKEATGKTEPAAATETAGAPEGEDRQATAQPPAAAKRGAGQAETLAEAEAGAARQPGKEEGTAREAVPLALRTVDYDETGQIFFTGRAVPGAALRLYVDNRYMADVRADENGDWTWRGETVIEPGRHALRIDRLAGDGRVIERIELPFVRAEVRAVAEARAAAGQRGLLERLEREAQVSGDAAAGSGKGEPGKDGGDEVPAAAPGEVRPAGGSGTARETATAAVETDAGTRGMKTVSAAAEGQGIRAETPSTGRKEPQVGFIVVQPGNNLWNISRVIYGRGVRYTTIYEANRDQIRDPDLIYPGQVFKAPGLPPRKLAINPRRRKPLSPEELEKAPLAVE